MYWSSFFIPTLKEDPADADVVSHTLMVRAGMIRKVTSGVYNYLPYGLRSINKVAQIVREEMNRAGAIEMTMPMVHPGELWLESGRWSEYGKELLRFKDRHDRDFCLGPTHEEVITDMARRELQSYRQLPVNFYQIQTKFRDEVRPRFGLMRCREFIMKDAYSFDRDDNGADKSYWAMFRAYEESFKRMYLRFKSVSADSGSIGGSFSHEFMVLANTGEDSVAACKKCAYAANIEKAPVRFNGKAAGDETSPLAIEAFLTPDAHTVEGLRIRFNLDAKNIVKTILYIVDGKKVAVMVRGDRSANEVKVKNHFNATTIDLMDAGQIEAVTGAPAGFAGPVGLKADAVLADNELREKNFWITGGNKKDTHFKNVYFKRDVPDVIYADMREITAGDVCPECGGEIEVPRGIEVGHVFKLGIKYSSAMDAKFLDEDGKEKFFVMGCYGIGITRVVAASIEQNHDDKGMILPPPIAPFEVIIINAEKGEQVQRQARFLHDVIENLGIDVIVDDRDERPGVKFNDADLIGVPLQIIVGQKLLEGKVEGKDRRTGERCELGIAGFARDFQNWKDKVYAGWSGVTR